MDSFGLDEEAENDCGAGKSSLEPEYVTPAAEGDDDTSDKWSWPSKHIVDVGG